MSLRFLHSADWQIGKAFRRIPGDRGALLREQRIATVATIAELAQERDVDAVLVAGDVFDDNAVADRTLRRTFEAMQGFHGDWILLPGNHDAALAESVWTRAERLGLRPDHVHLALTPQPLLVADGALAVLPAPLRQRREPLDLTAWFDNAQTPADAVRVGLAHGSVTNRLPDGAATHNPISDTRAEQARLDYLALGDWHGLLEIAPRTWYSGTPETDSFRANDPGFVLEVTLDAPGGTPAVRPHATSRYRWQRLAARITTREDLAALDARLRELAPPVDRHLLHLELTGAPTLSVRSELDDLIGRWEARLHYLRIDDSEMTLAASDADLAPLRGSGFLGDAVARLEAAREQREPWADDALQRLYLAWHRRRDGDS